MPLMELRMTCSARRLLLLLLVLTAVVCSVVSGVVHHLGDADFDQFVDSLPEDALLLVDFYKVGDSRCELMRCDYCIVVGRLCTFVFGTCEAACNVLNQNISSELRRPAVNPHHQQVSGMLCSIDSWPELSRPRLIWQPRLLLVALFWDARSISTTGNMNVVSQE